MKDYYKVFLIDDHKIILDGLTLMLKSETNLVIIGTASDGITAQNAILNLNPDLVIMDIRIPDKDGLEIIKCLHGKVKTKFIVLSMYIQGRYVKDAKRYGAHSFLHKTVDKNELLKSINLVMAGEFYFPLQEESFQEKKFTISPREMDILKLIVKGFKTSEIAQKLFVSEYTIDTHRKNLLKKTCAKNVAGLIKYANDNEIDCYN